MSLFLFSSLTAPAQQLPDGSPFPFWEDSTEYRKTYYVSQLHPEASDRNTGTRTRPFKSIGQAAEVLQPGEKVVIFSGIYREAIRLARGGESARRMIAYEAAPGAEVVVKGTEIAPPKWEQSLSGNGTALSLKLWQLPLDSVPALQGKHPFNSINATAEDIELMPWAEAWKNRFPYTLQRGLLFQKGQRLTQLAHYGDLTRLPGSWWVDTLDRMLHLHPLDWEDPNEALIEITTREQLFQPKEVGASYIKVKGLIFEQAGNGFPRIGVGAVFVNGGHHWIIEDNTVRQVNSVGIEIGARVTERAASTAKENERVRAHPGGFIVRHNEVHDCGTGGIQGHTVRNTLLEDNHLHHMGWQEAEYYWECAAIKLLVNRNTLVQRNTIHDIEAACGIWLDWDNHNSRVCYNLLYDFYRASGGAIYVEASRTPNWIDHNILWNIARLGISVYDTENAKVQHNLIAHCGIPWGSRINTSRSLNGKKMTSVNNAFRYNIIYRNKEWPIIQLEDNVSNFNLFSGKDLAEWQKQGWDKDSYFQDMEMAFSPKTGELQVHTPAPMPYFPAGEGPLYDFHGLAPVGEQWLPGPFQRAFEGALFLKIKL